MSIAMENRLADIERQVMELRDLLLQVRSDLMRLENQLAPGRFDGTLNLKGARR
jgi:phage shock protein A